MKGIISMIINQAQSTVDESEGKDLLLVENQYWVSMHESLERLKRNDDFKRVILDGYFKDKAINGVSLLATDYVKKNQLRAEIMEQLVAVSNLEDYFATISNLGTIPDETDEE